MFNNMFLKFLWELGKGRKLPIYLNILKGGANQGVYYMKGGVVADCEKLWRTKRNGHDRAGTGRDSYRNGITLYRRFGKTLATLQRHILTRWRSQELRWQEHAFLLQHLPQPGGRFDGRGMECCIGHGNGTGKRTGPGRKNVADVARDFGLLPP